MAPKEMVEVEDGVKATPPPEPTQAERDEARKQRALSMEEDMFDGATTLGEMQGSARDVPTGEHAETNVARLEAGPPPPGSRKTCPTQIRDDPDEGD